MSLLSRWFPRRTAYQSLAAVVAEPWLVKPEAFLGAFQEIATQAQVFTSAGDIRAAMADVEDDEDNLELFEIHNGVAVIPIHGLIMKEIPCAFRFFGTPATSTRETKEIFADVLANDEVKSIFLDIDSPGGTVSGTASLADVIYRANQFKPVHGHASDLAASAAYWIGSQAVRLTCGETAEVGSIGAYKLLIDRSKQAEADGLMIHRLASGPYKGVGVPGVPITEAQLAVEQELVDGINGLFQQAILRGRPELTAEALKGMATGRVWLGVDAHKLGLVDAVLSVEEAFEDTITAGQEDRQDEAESGPESEGESEMPFRRKKPEESDSKALAEAKAYIGQLEGERDQAVAERDEAVERAENLRTKFLASVLKKHQAAGRFDAGTRPAMEQRAEKFGDDIDEFDAMLAESGTRDKRKPTGGMGSSDSKPRKNADPEETRLARMLGLSEEDLQDDGTMSFSLVDGSAQ